MFGGMCVCVSVKLEMCFSWFRPAEGFSGVFESNAEGFSVK